MVDIADGGLDACVSVKPSRVGLGVSDEVVEEHYRGIAVERHAPAVIALADRPARGRGTMYEVQMLTGVRERRRGPAVAPRAVAGQ